jgi:hypothetical protein
MPDIPQPPDMPLTGQPASGPFKQGTRQQHQAQWEQPYPADSAHRDLDMMRDQPQQAGRTKHPRQPTAHTDVRGSDPADESDQHQHGEPAGGRRQRGDPAGHQHGTRRQHDSGWAA